MDKFTDKEYWRLLILYGVNASTYKMALAQCLYQLTQQGKTDVSIHELAKLFFDTYEKRLKNGMPQLNNECRSTKMEQIVTRYDAGAVDYDSAITFTEQNAFGDVIPRFHVLNNRLIENRFFDTTNEGIVLTDSVYNVFDDNEHEDLLRELDARWSLLESSYAIKQQNAKLINDIKKNYLIRGYERTDITYMRDMLRGYQDGRCFYCGEPLVPDHIHVDHVIPRSFLNHDQPWNLVLSHEFCNENKSDMLPSKYYIYKLIDRNERLIRSNHPLSNQIKQDLGITPKQRKDHTLDIYNQILNAVKYTWEGIKGFNPETDPFYKKLVREFTQYGK